MTLLFMGGLSEKNGAVSSVVEHLVYTEFRAVFSLLAIPARCSRESPTTPFFIGESAIQTHLITLSHIIRKKRRQYHMAVTMA
jgi:hypothetical protein